MSGKKARGQSPAASDALANVAPVTGPDGARPDGGFTAQVQLLLNANRLRDQQFGRAEVLTLWRKAVGAAHDAALTGLTSDNAVRLAYDAGHAAALALLAAHGLRTGGGPGHHEVAFAGAAGLGDPALADLVPDSEEIRRLRHGSMYDPVIAGPLEVADALRWVGQTLPAIREALVRRDASLHAELAAYP
jgi:hypothetical protein